MPDELRLHVLPRLQDAVLLLAFEGWNDAGEAATAAARYIASALAPAPLAEIDPEEFYDFTVARPTVKPGEGGVRTIDWPRTEFLYGSLDGRAPMVVGVGVEPHQRWRRYTDLVLELAREAGVRRVVLLGAFLADVLYSRPVSVTGFASSPELLEGLGIPASAYQGPTGIVGVLGQRFIEAGLEVTSLWAALPHYITVQPNPRGALALVQVLQRGFGLKIDEGPLARRAAEFEEQVSALVAADPELAEYVRALKRREFAQ